MKRTSRRGVNTIEYHWMKYMSQHHAVMLQSAMLHPMAHSTNLQVFVPSGWLLCAFISCLVVLAHSAFALRGTDAVRGNTRA